MYCKIGLKCIKFNNFIYRFVNLAFNFKGDIIISIGNYENNSFKYLQYLEDHFILIKKYILSMPWNLEEQLKIYKRK